jgi:hypothetical protein
MENYESAQLEIKAISASDTISVSVDVGTGENELPVDKY